MAYTKSLDLERSSSQNGTVTPQNTGNSGTFMFWMDPEFDPTAASTEFVFGGTPGAGRFLFYHNGFADSYGLFIGGSSMTDGDGSLSGLVDSGWTHITFAWDSALSGDARVKVYKNGALFASISADPAGNMPATLYIGSNNGESNFYDGLLSGIRIYDSQLSAATISDEYCLTVPSSAGLIDHWTLDDKYTNEVVGSNTITPGGSPVFATDVWTNCDVTNTTIVAEQGSYTLTGQDVGLSVSRTMIAEQGSYVLTGQDVTLTVGVAPLNYPISIETGYYALNGQDVTLQPHITPVWSPEGKTSSTWANESKSSSTWSNQNK